MVEAAPTVPPATDIQAAPLRKPTRFGEYLAGFMVLAIVGVIAIAIGSANDVAQTNSPAPQTAKMAVMQPDPKIAEQKRLAEAAERAQKDADCRKDLKCWAEKGTVAASVYCRDQVEKLANFSMKWTDAWYETKFSHYRWSRKDQSGRGIVTYLGDKAQFQNGFGAFQNVIYTCDMIPEDKDHTIFDVSASPGRLN